jgi:hypothetical protein
MIATMIPVKTDAINPQPTIANKTKAKTKPMAPPKYQHRFLQASFSDKLLMVVPLPALRKIAAYL